MTVFLTTQYLEEADVLADRVGIIDRGRIVARARRTALKAEIGRPTVELVPADPADRARRRGVLARFGTRDGRAARRGRRSASHGGADASPTSCARSTPRACASSTSSCTRRRSTTSSWRRPAARSRAPARTRDAAAEPVPARPLSATLAAGRRRSRGARSCGRCASRALIVPPIVFPLVLLAVNASGPRRGDEHPGLPRPTTTSTSRSPSRSCRARCSRRSTPARDARARHRDRLPQPPRADADAAPRAARRPARAACCSSRSPRRSSTSSVGLHRRRVHVAAGRGRGARAAGARDAHRRSASRALGALIGAALRLGRGGAGPLPAVLRPALPVVVEPAARRSSSIDWFRTIATYNPLSYLSRAIRSLIIVGWDGEALALGVRLRDRASPCSASAVGVAALRDAAGAHMRRFADVAGRGALAQRSHNVLDDPGAASCRRSSSRCSSSSPSRAACRRSANVPGFDFPLRLHGVPVRLRLPPVGGVRRRVHGLRRSRADFESGFGRRLLLAAPNRLGDPRRLRRSPRSCARC